MPFDGDDRSGVDVPLHHQTPKAVLSGACIRNDAEVVRTISRMTGDDVASFLVDVLARKISPMTNLISAHPALLFKTPDAFFGNLRDVSALFPTPPPKRALLIVVHEAAVLGLIKAPGQNRADIAVGEGQSIGNSLNFGGPYVGLFAVLIETASARYAGAPLW